MTASDDKPDEITPSKSGITATKSSRWATQKVSRSKSAARKRQSILDRFHRNITNEKKRKSDSTNSSGVSGQTGVPEAVQEGEEEEEEDTDASGERTVYFNRPLPPEARDEDGHPVAKYNRNKIRTAKYTPLSFVPKNLWFQFHNVANVYFLLLIVIGFFEVFGNPNPALGAVPLIVILFITAVKDAVEDWRRTVLDNELNNSPVHRLVDWNNVNTSEDDISLWRQFKKANSRAIVRTWRLLKGWQSKKKGGEKTYAQRALDEGRASVDTRRSIYSIHDVEAATEAEEGIQMTPVPSPLPLDKARQAELDPMAQKMLGSTTESGKSNGAPPVRFYGSLIDPYKQTPGKARFKKDYWKSVQVGDFVRLYNDDEIPADIVVLSTSDPEGACYVETKNLDGETNLKVRTALQAGKKIRHARDCEKADFILESEPPHANLYSYNGVVKWMQRDPKDSEAPGKEMMEPVSINNLLLRGCSLRNTEWVLGVVVFTGPDTKIMLNAGITASKRSRIARDLNWYVLYNFAILLVMCIVSGVVQGTNWAEGGNTLDFFEFGSEGGSPPMDGFITFWSALILFQNLVPISLYITLEIIKTLQAFFIYSDHYMYYAPIDYPCTPKSWNISDDVGQIEYIFSDKTGTLTQNVMEFKKCTINGVPYGEAYTEAQAGMQKRQGIDVVAEGEKARKQIAEDRIKMLEDMRRIHDNPYLHDDKLTFVAPDFVQDLEGVSGEEQAKANTHFMLALALCHTVIAERKPGDPPTVEFQAQSPDEAALVATARDCGFTVLGRTNDGIIINVQGEELEYKVLNILEFNSSRKRMSAIIRMPDGRIILFCKGADSVIWARLRRGEQETLRKETADHLEMFAREGLRTLCIAQRELSEDEYQTWSQQHDVAAAAVQDRDEKLEEVSDAIERQLSLLGGTAIEDRLQDGVPDTISLLADAGIKLWVLTGDKVETAINIGFSCNLLGNDMDLIVFKLEDGSIEKASEKLDEHLATFGMTGSDEELTAARSDHSAPAPTHAIVIDGDSLKVVLDESIRQKFLLLCKQCKSVLCCRVSPSQKAAVVAMVKQGLDVMTLSIGDGANDVAMIQEADVGVGIAGEEGRQAVMSSDYAIGQFRFLQRLVLVHGRWSYRRLGETIANFFYKNIVWTFALFWYQIYDDFDCVYLFDYTYVLLVNLAFTSLPVIFMGVLDQDVNDKVSLAVPQLYRRGIERKEWTAKKFWLYMGDGIYQSAICFFTTYLLFRPANFETANGLGINDTSRMGVYVANATILVVNTYVLMNTYRWDWLMVVITIFSILLIWFWTGVYTAFTNSEYFYRAAPQVYGQLSFWANTLITLSMCLVPRFFVKAIQKVFLPYDVDIIREKIRLGEFAYLDKVAPDEVANAKPSPVASSEISALDKQASEGKQYEQDDDRRPIYPPSVAPTATTHNNRSQNGSDGTDYTGHPRRSMERSRAMSPHLDPPSRPLSMERPRPSFDRMRSSMDVLRPSFEASADMTSASQLARLESSQSDAPPKKRTLGLSKLRS